jgi:hypothetical protein
MAYPNPLESTRYRIDAARLYEAIEGDILRGKIEPGKYQELRPVMDILGRYVKDRQSRGKSVISPTTSKSEDGALAKTFAKVLREACAEDELRRINVPVYGKVTQQMKYFRVFLDEAEVQLLRQKENKAYRPFIRAGSDKVIDADAKAVASWVADYYYDRDLRDYVSLPKDQKTAKANEFYEKHGIGAAVPAGEKPPTKASMRAALVNKLAGSHDYEGLKAIYWSIAEKEKLAEVIRTQGMQLDLF